MHTHFDYEANSQHRLVTGWRPGWRSGWRPGWRLRWRLEAKLPYASAAQTPLRWEMEVQTNAHLGALGSAGLSWRHVAEGDKCASLCGGVVVVLVGGIGTMFDYGWEWV